MGAEVPYRIRCASRHCRRDRRGCSDTVDFDDKAAGTLIVPEVLRRLDADCELDGCELADVELTGSELEDVEREAVELEDVTLEDVMDGCEVEGCELEDVEHAGVDLED